MTQSVTETNTENNVDCNGGEMNYALCLSVSCDGEWTGRRCEERTESVDDLFWDQGIS